MKYLFILLKTFLILLTLSSFSFGQELNPYDISIDRENIILKGKFYVVGEDGLFPTVILLQGFPGNEKDVLGIGAKLTLVGINVLTFNYSGTNKSEGEFNFDNSQKDIEAAFKFIHKSENVQKYKIDTTRVILGGYSFGGGMALTYAANHPEITDVFSIAGTDHGEFFREYARNLEMKKMIDEMFDELSVPTGTVRFKKGGLPKEIIKNGKIELNPIYDLRKSAPLMTGKNILLIGGWEDINVTIDDHLLPLYRALKNEKIENVEFIVYHTNHSFKNVRDDLTNTIYNWIVNKD
ncbi:MAG: alpha/beta fold hydrolase [Ignavibacteriaceae bacterium]|nr:alpha/beta fold hydrolase [Ignavibacteriaceae bacterium]MCW8961311.1 alpha/beta fold hydrolase [Ignavibacteriaceae bacterium]MCW9096558.1 alpha/beta fold hydrolase [Ignavibacteriaceae bacterium]